MYRGKPRGATRGRTGCKRGWSLKELMGEPLGLPSFAASGVSWQLKIFGIQPKYLWNGWNIYRLVRNRKRLRSIVKLFAEKMEVFSSGCLWFL